jgi:site-specific recombinase XerD
MSGASPSELAAILGHKTLAMVARYSHVGEQHTADILKKMTNKFLADGQ